jgi:hypothetical protein
VINLDKIPCYVWQHNTCQIINYNIL